MFPNPGFGEFSSNSHSFHDAIPKYFLPNLTPNQEHRQRNFPEEENLAAAGKIPGAGGERENSRGLGDPKSPRNLDGFGKGFGRDLGWTWDGFGRDLGSQISSLME